MHFIIFFFNYFILIPSLDLARRDIYFFFFCLIRNNEERPCAVTAATSTGRVSITINRFDHLNI